MTWYLTAGDGLTLHDECVLYQYSLYHYYSVLTSDVTRKRKRGKTEEKQLYNNERWNSLLLLKVTNVSLEFKSWLDIARPSNSSHDKVSHEFFRSVQSLVEFRECKTISIIIRSGL